MSKRTVTQTKKLKRGGILLLTALMSVAILAGCGTKKNAPSSNKAKTKQSLNVVPGKNAAEKGDKNSDKGKSTLDSGENAKNKQPTTSVSNKTDSKKTSPKKTGSKKSAQNSTSANKSSSVMTAPEITVQPINALAAPGGTATFSITVKDASLQKYAWKVDKNDGNGWTDISGANASGYTVSDVTTEQNGWKYRCVVTNQAGSSESQEASLYVRESTAEKSDSGGTGNTGNAGSANNTGNAGNNGNTDGAANAGSAKTAEQKGGTTAN